MSATAAPFGFIPLYDLAGGDVRTQAFANAIPSGYASPIYSGTPVTLNTSGQIVPVTLTTDSVLGVLAGVEYIDANGKPTVAPNWVAGTVATNVKVWVYTAPTIVYKVQANGSLAQAAIGDNANIVTGSGAFGVAAGSTATGLSTAGLSSTLTGSAASGQFRIFDLEPAVDNAWGDSYTVARVTIAKHPFVASLNAI